MTFRDELDADFENILGGEYSSRILFSPGTANEWDTRGIFDDSFEPVETGDQSQVMVAKSARLTVWYKDAPVALTDGILCRVYSDETTFETFKISGEPQYDSEGNALIFLHRDES